MNETNSRADANRRRRRLPSLRALQAFEAAGRLGSFRSAAEELNVTHSAISHQVKALEEDLGASLFVRGGRAVALTTEGRILLPILRDAFDSIGAGADLIGRRRGGGALTVQVYVTVAVKWLMPRLGDFQARRPGAGVALATSISDWGFARDVADAAIVFAAAEVEGLDVTPLHRGEMFPVCAPELLEGAAALRTPADLRRYPLLNVYTSPDDWPRWLAAAGVEGLGPTQLVSYDSYLLALEAAMRGEGVAISYDLYAAPDLADGRLVRPFEIATPAGAALSFVCPKERARDPRIAGFRDWLVEQMR
eukprot:g977.t1